MERLYRLVQLCQPESSADRAFFEPCVALKAPTQRLTE
jgi:hypothetical protein